MIGLILWLVVIFIIMCLVCPGFLTVTIICIVIGAVLYGLYLWIESKFLDK